MSIADRSKLIIVGTIVFFANFFDLVSTWLVSPNLAAEWVVRTMLSYITFPGRTGADRRAMRRQLRQLLLPALFKE